MLSPTSQTAWDRQSRSSFPPSLSLFIYLSQLSSMLSATLIYLLLFLSHSLNLSAHSLALRHLQFFSPFFIWISQSCAFPLLFIIHQLISPSFFITFLPQEWKWKWFSSKIIELQLPLLFPSIVFLTQFWKYNGETGKENRAGEQNKKISQKHVLRFSQSLTGCCYFKNIILTLLLLVADW